MVKYFKRLRCHLKYYNRNDQSSCGQRSGFHVRKLRKFYLLLYESILDKIAKNIKEYGTNKCLVSEIILCNNVLLREWQFNYIRPFSLLHFLANWQTGAYIVHFNHFPPPLSRESFFPNTIAVAAGGRVQIFKFSTLKDEFLHLWESF